MRTTSVLVLVWLLVGCSSEGTESGNPTRGVCLPTITLVLSDAATRTSVGTAVTVDGQSLGCSESSTASSCDLTALTPGTHDIVVAAAGHAAKTLSVTTPAASRCCPCTAGAVVDISLEPLP